MITLAKVIGSPFQVGHIEWQDLDPSILTGWRVGASEYESLYDLV